jgi:hypothetical protein
MNNEPAKAHYTFIGIKIFVILIYLKFRPYINCFFDFFKIIQEIHFIIISSILIKIKSKNKELN